MLIQRSTALRSQSGDWSQTFSSSSPPLFHQALAAHLSYSSCLLSMLPPLADGDITSVPFDAAVPQLIAVHSRSIDVCQQRRIECKHVIDSNALFQDGYGCNKRDIFQS
jgi:hypothetical protein